ncbi:thiamine pyrophosphate-dependent enzyme [Candidatus Aminicenantes bacterium AC-708-M15]|jgi:thiamine pyrophosphate-dependent acetolactate synthase large subunit-like protein|nr:thiamine pyrophosphate-dependent enzyme [SCandidatus Aminicenantes bacterium Aminicenantia_JdfR_composite]MCP2596331.1 thiamine pyrophosphate-dependent enzyme [Candidatus Aminicenantes bacterium AC-335-G13]MCP2599143.1 thiamine pyrophosphate-dependent enzyme [Candidatus Aminicenantes bacterium AC-335-B20]MCP2604506.1 thiamine pyrophosphate-dependent enzyme [Candidatus Aminicenantes bacterium AC-708-M15]MCP2605428.1 thiamine pyrophosphate-dependent enzyme [Candidatus Aminicenantes bacterium A
MNRLEAIKIVIENLSGDELLVHANGAISRESFFCKNRKENFYLLGSMGLASSVGFGLALNQPNKKIVILDGDGNVLMGFGNLALIGAFKPKNLIHLVFDNQVYGTTGNQPTISKYIPFSEVAKLLGYRTSHYIDKEDSLKKIFKEILKEPGPHFLHIKVSPEVTQICPRIPYSAKEIKERFISSLK